MSLARLRKKKEANYRKLLVPDIKQRTSLKKSVKLMSLARLRKKKKKQIIENY